ncbi:MAG: multidrug ABC transporter permease [Flavobacteriaceae bacterium]|nr:MAG: multidrug ABC transporter permease [Flavobacteriaceae bacterium]
MDRRKALKNTAMLVGAALSTSTLSTLMQSCTEQNRLSWEPVFFDAEQAQNVSAMVDMILPKTDTPGALELHVDMFVDLMFEKTLSPEDKEHVMTGYARFVAICDEMYGTVFYKMNTTEKTAVLTKLGEETNHFVPRVWGSKLEVQEPLDFYRRLKSFTLTGYFTSEEIGKNVLRFDPIPGGYNGCLPYNGENIWTI